METNAKHKFKILTTIPMDDNDILAGEPLKYSIDDIEYSIPQFTYKTYMEFNKSLHSAGLFVLTFPNDELEKKLFENPDKIQQSAILTAFVSSKVNKDRWIIDLVTAHSKIDRNKRFKLIPNVIYTSRLKKRLKTVNFAQLIILFESLLRFNFAIKKKLLHILKTNPDQLQAEALHSGTLQSLPKAFSDLAKNGIPVPVYSR